MVSGNRARVQDSLTIKELLSKIYKERGQEGDNANSDFTKGRELIQIK